MAKMWTGPKFEQSTSNWNICSTSTHVTSWSELANQQHPREGLIMTHGCVSESGEDIAVETWKLTVNILALSTAGQLTWLQTLKVKPKLLWHLLVLLFLTAPELLRSKLILRSDKSDRSTRATDRGQLQLPRVRTEFARFVFLVRASKHWNDTL